MPQSSPIRCADRSGRRRLLQVGALGSFGLPQLLAGRLAAEAAPESSVSAGSGFGRARACILLFMWGGPSQLDTFDLKPEAPAEIRGEFNSIATNVGGLRFCEHFPLLARHADKLAVVRSLTHDDPAHLSSAHTILTGHLPPVNKSDAEPPSERDTPHIGSVLARLRPGTHRLPPFVAMPWAAYHPAAPGGKAPGQTGGWLGHAYDPLLVTGDPSQADWKVPELALAEGLSLERLTRREELLSRLQSPVPAGGTGAEAALGQHQQRALELLASPDVAGAFELSGEPDEVRDRYGRHVHGQCVLLARRLVERGVPLVAINWHNDGRNFWDTHGNNFQRLKTDLIPPADQALSALLADLHERGMLEETIVAWVGEFGRNPKITAGNAGREHWPYCYSGLLAGGGIRGGTVFGSSDNQAAYPASDPVSPHDFSATLYHALGVDPQQTLADTLGRPHAVYGGQPLYGLF